MRHRVYGRHLGRDTNKRNALFKSLVRSLIIYETIETTDAKAKSIKGLVDKLVNKAKNPNTRRLVGQFLQNQKIFNKLVNDLVPYLGHRNSGYTSVVKTGRRLGDGAVLVQIGFIKDEAKTVRKTESPENTTAFIENEQINLASQTSFLQDPLKVKDKQTALKKKKVRAEKK